MGLRDTLELMLQRGQDSPLLRYSLGGECLKAGDALAAVTHLSEAVAQNPALLGTPQLRDARLTSGRLELSASEPLPEGGLRRHVLTWTRLR